MLARDKRSILFCLGFNDKEEAGFLTLTSSAKVIKLFTVVSYEFL
jgi:hypothetical protein